jgi:NTE family protein
MTQAAITQPSRRSGGHALAPDRASGATDEPASELRGDAMKRRTFDHEILLLQGGGALGAYHCGIYEGLAEFGVTPNWFVGISIGAVNSAILAGNPPERRLERLRTFWDRASEFSKHELPSFLEWMRPMMGKLNFATVATSGIPGFFKPRSLPPDLATSGTPEALSYYDTSPLRETLKELVDFDLINSGEVRLSLGAVNVRTAESVYWDSKYTRITPDHVLSSGALPPGFPAIKIGSEYYYDGGLVSNSPMQYIVSEKPLTSALIVQANCFNAHGKLPRTLDEAMERVKDIQFASKQRLNTQRAKELLEMRTALGRLLAKLPPDLKADPDVRKLTPLCDNRDWTIVQMNNRRPAHGGQYKDAEFSRSAVLARWAAGLDDVRFSTANLDWVQPAVIGEGVRVFHFPPVGLHGPEGSGRSAPRIADIPEGPEDKIPHDTVRTA